MAVATVFAGPWIAEMAPQALVAEKAITLVVGALAAYLLFALGWMLFGIALLRAPIGPVAIPVAIIAAGALGFRSGLPPFGVPIGLAVAALGTHVIRAGRPVATS